MKILTLDIETAPNIAHVWDLRNNFVSLNQLMQASELLCCAFKFHDEETTHFALGDSYVDIYSEATGIVPLTIFDVYDAVNTADAVVTYNGKKFDMPKLNSAFLEAGYDPPRPYADIDLWRVVAKTFGWPSTKLDFVVQRLGIGAKVQHIGHELWVKCMAGDFQAWMDMQTYNVGDVIATEALYDKLRPWIPSHPNVHLYDEMIEGCTKCGSQNVQKRGKRAASTGVYQQYQCRDCGGWYRGTRRIAGTTYR